MKAALSERGGTRKVEGRRERTTEDKGRRNEAERWSGAGAAGGGEGDPEREQ